MGPGVHQGNQGQAVLQALKIIFYLLLSYFFLLGKLHSIASFSLCCIEQEVSG